MIKRLLLGIGGTAFTPVAIERAVEVAAQKQARITAVTVTDPDRVCNFGPVPVGAGIYAKRLCDKRLEVTKGSIEEGVSAFEAACRKSNVAHDVVRETGDAFDLMINYARYHDLTVFGLRSLFDYQLVEQPEKDLFRLLSNGVRPILAVSNERRPTRRAMVAYSGSMESAKAMRHFVQSGLWPDAALEIVTFADGSVKDDRLLDDAAAYCRDHGYTVATHRRTGKAEGRLLETARELEADMIVMGNSFRNIWLRKVLGDITLKTLIEADRPLFLSQ